ncbi:hypothetical protein B1748_29185 [Paenibacillus sp. MY03]|uniref:hypothetical protein n=1 Tax=Paenibacillus sp. MY03 TaxID=302980 RepID=UPI000B3CE13A|nr:hypothetical protein [Paenibacillus sp. MY03]OUS70311.1 hypothetical protein B1748_29185 [Paenibacillus sp. MY03]
MAGSFLLTLDTTGPEIAVYMPSYSTTSVDNEVIVQSSEQLAPWQDFYFVDAAGDRHNFIFAYDGDRFVGLVRFNQFALGVAVLYAQVKDEVDNPSPIVTQPINIMAGAYMTVCGSMSVRSIATFDRKREVETGRTARKIEVRTA